MISRKVYRVVLNGLNSGIFIYKVAENHIYGNKVHYADFKTLKEAKLCIIEYLESCKLTLDSFIGFNKDLSEEDLVVYNKLTY